MSVSESAMNENLYIVLVAGWNPGRREYGIQEDTLDVAVARDGRVVTRMNSNLDGIVDAWVNTE